MGRVKTLNTHLPRRIRESRGRYFYVDGRHRASAKWTNLGTDLSVALAMHQRIIDGADPAEIDVMIRHTRPLDELRGLMPGRELRGPGVYFLWRGEDLHYVGRSKNVANRLRYHRLPATGIQHDNSTALPCDRFTSLLIEAVHIEYYRPPANEILF